MLIVDYVEIPLWIPIVVGVAVLFYIHGTLPLQVWKKLGVPGPGPSPFLGNTKDLFNDKVGICANMKKWQEKYGRIIGIFFFLSPALIVTDKEALRQIFVKEFNNFTDRFMSAGGTLQQPIIKKGVFFEDGTSWQRIRRIMTPAFSSGKMKLIFHFINRTAKRLSDNLVALAEAKVQPEAKHVFGAFTMDVIAATAFGLDLDSQKDLKSPFITRMKSMIKSDKIVRLKVAAVNIFPILGLIFRKLNVGLFNSNDVAYFKKQMYALIEERKLHPEQFKQQDFIQILMNAEADTNEEIVGSKRLTHDEVAAQGILFILAGYETSSTAMQYLAYELARHRDIQNKLIEEIHSVIGDDRDPTYEDCNHLKYTEAVINEILRMYPPLHLITRQALHDTNLMGVPVPAKTAIYIPLYNLGRDPEYFTDPDTFDPERFLGDRKRQMDAINFLPFGFGPRQCMGLRLAMLQLKIALIHIFKKVEIIGVTPDVLDIEDYSGVLIPKQPIRLVLRKRVSEKHDV